FSSRRRHTRFSRDWSSDVCSSDLTVSMPTSPFAACSKSGVATLHHGTHDQKHQRRTRLPAARRVERDRDEPELLRLWSGAQAPEIGRASCRERVEDSTRELRVETE